MQKYFIYLFLFLTTTIVFAQDVTPTQINALLRSGETRQVDDGISKIRAMMKDRPEVARGSIRGWTERLRDINKFPEAAEFAKWGLLESASDVGSCESWLLLRIQILLRDKRVSEAQKDAKSYFNVCRMDQTAQALQKVGETLNADPSASLNRADEFMREQKELATTQPTSRPSTILHSIAIDRADYDPAIEKIDPRKFVITSEELTSWLAVANLLLIADRAEEAEQIFRQLLEKARPEQKLSLNEGIARSIKARTGSIGPANAYIRSLRRN